MKIQRLVLVEDDKSRTVTKEKILTIPIKPGIPSGTRIVFPNEGDQGPTKIPGKSLYYKVMKSINKYNLLILTNYRLTVKHYCPITYAI